MALGGHNVGANEEQIYHDRTAKDIDVDSLLVYETFEAATAPENRFIMQLLGDIKGKSILDLGCGAGESSVYFAIKGAHVSALDVSPGMVEIGKKIASSYGVNIQWSTTDATLLPFDDGFFDIVYGNGVLHHLTDISATLGEIHRVLRPGGSTIFIEPLAHNPVINVYRKIAKEVRTIDERPFKLKELEALFYNEFGNCSHEEFWLFTLWLFVRFFLIERVSPNRERYWKKIIREHQRLDRIYGTLERIDKKVLTLFPFLRRYCWNTVVSSQKRVF